MQNFIEGNEMVQLASGAIPAINFIHKKYVNVTSSDISDLSVSKTEVEKIKKDFHRLKRVYKNFLTKLI